MPPEKKPRPTPDGPPPKYRLYADDGSETALCWLLRYLSVAPTGCVVRSELRHAWVDLYVRRGWSAKDHGRRRLTMILRQLDDAGIAGSCGEGHLHVRDRDGLVQLLKTRRVLPPEVGAVTGRPCAHCGQLCVNFRGGYSFAPVDLAGRYAPELEGWQPARQVPLCRSYADDPSRTDCYTQVTRDRRTIGDTVPPPRFVCPICGRRSWSADERAQGWCGRCREHTADPGSGGTALPQ